MLGAKSRTTEDGRDSLVAFLERCWDAVPYLRPKMEEVVEFFTGLIPS